MGKVKFAVIGSGYIGKRHAELIQKNENCELVAMVDINPELETTIKTQFGIPFFNTPEAFFNSKIACDVVNICTPNGLHAQQASLALDHGFHVVIEKPIGLSKAACEEVIYKSLRVNRKVFCVMQNRYSPPSKWLKEVIDSGKLGDIYMVQLNCYWNRDDRYYKKGGWKGTQQLDGGTLFTQFSHFIDIMYWVFGDITDIQGKFNDFSHAHSTEFEDSGMVNFRFTQGGMGALNYSTSVWDKNLESSLTIIGSKGSIKVGGQYMDKVEYCHIDGYTMPELDPVNPANDYGPYKGSAANHHYVIQNVVDVIQGIGSIDTNALEGLKVVEIIERIYGVRDNN